MKEDVESLKESLQEMVEENRRKELLGTRGVHTPSPRGSPPMRPHSCHIDLTDENVEECSGTSPKSSTPTPGGGERTENHTSDTGT